MLGLLASSPCLECRRQATGRLLPVEQAHTWPPGSDLEGQSSSARGATCSEVNQTGPRSLSSPVVHERRGRHGDRRVTRRPRRAGLFRPTQRYRVRFRPHSVLVARSAMNHVCRRRGAMGTAMVVLGLALASGSAGQGGPDRRPVARRPSTRRWNDGVLHPPLKTVGRLKQSGARKHGRRTSGRCCARAAFPKRLDAVLATLSGANVSVTSGFCDEGDASRRCHRGMRRPAGTRSCCGWRSDPTPARETPRAGPSRESQVGRRQAVSRPCSSGSDERLQDLHLHPAMACRQTCRVMPVKAIE